MMRSRLLIACLCPLEHLGIVQPIENYYLIGTYPPLKAMGSVDPLDFIPQATSNCMPRWP
jgi:oxygen-independent coproporphyrinogen III oxidase